MAKKPSASFQPERLRSMTSDETKNRQWTEEERQVLRRIAERQAAGDDTHINYEVIPRLTEEQ